MIEFPCRCGHPFRLEDDQAGGMVQCPQCRRLNDVPTRDDLGNLAEDGTYRVEDAPRPREEADALGEFTYVYQRGARDRYGNEIDLRNTDADIEAVGIGEPLPLNPETRQRPNAPKYDPESGELIAPIELKPDGRERVDPATVPMARATLSYAAALPDRQTSLVRAFLRMLWPINLVVMGLVLCMHILMWPVIFVTAWGMFVFVGVEAIISLLIVAHYGCVIEETGVCERDELPRPLRDVEWYQDLWMPFCNVFGSVLICYGPCMFLPLLLAHARSLDRFEIALFVLLGATGTFWLPAVMLTLQCSGTILNLRPDRVLAVIHACGPGYLGAVVLWVLAVASYTLGWVGTGLALVEILHPTNLPFWLTGWVIVLPALLAGVFLMHFYCVWLGLQYRMHYDRFPWVMQRHISTRVPGTNQA